jgi:cell division protein FtsI (penicillin-binding protein 3)
MSAAGRGRNGSQTGKGRAGAGGTGAARAARATPARSTMSEARRYTPRARTVRDGDPFRPALEILQGGRSREVPSRKRDVPAQKAAPAKKAAPIKKAAPTKKATAAAKKPTVQRTARANASRVAAAPSRRSRASTARTYPARTPMPARTRKKQPKAAAPPRPADPQRRLRLATVLALAMFLLIGGRLVQLQLTDGSAYAAEGLADRLREIDLPAPRGTIYDRDENILVHSIEARYIYADPTGIADPEATAALLFPLLAPYGVTQSELVTKMTKRKRDNGSPVMFEYLARGVDIEDGDKVKALNLEGIGVHRDERREVPGNDLAANVLGFTQRGDDPKGLAGLEDGYDKTLRGAVGKRQFEVGVGSLNKEIPSGYTSIKPAQPGTSLRLTIERDLQYEFQTTLYQRMKAENATFACAVAIEVRTGEILAQASYPTFNAAKPLDTKALDRRDACTEIVFDPGSIHKAIVMGGALQERVITPESVITVGPSIRKGDQTYTDTQPQPENTPLTIPGVLALSSNIGTIKVADMLGAQKLYEYQQRFGLGKRTGCGLPAESPGALLPPAKWSGSSPGSIPIGAGVATTALQMASAYAAIANDGVWIAPHLVQGTVSPGGGRYTPANAAESRRVIDANHAAELRLMLEAVTSASVPGATGKTAAIQGYRIAGKTGTGELPQDGGYAPGKVVSFVGMAPAEAPRYVIAVFAHTPGGGGGSVAGPVFRDLMAFTLGHFQVPPTGTPPPTFKIRP